MRNIPQYRPKYLPGDDDNGPINIDQSNYPNNPQDVLPPPAPPPPPYERLQNIEDTISVLEGKVSGLDQNVGDISKRVEDLESKPKKTGVFARMLKKTGGKRRRSIKRKGKKGRKSLKKSRKSKRRHRRTRRH